MMMLRTSSQSTWGEARRSVSRAIHVMLPCSPAATKARRRWPSLGTAAGEVTPKAEKPSLLAREASSRAAPASLIVFSPQPGSRRRSKIEIGVVLGRRHAGDAVGQERTKARPGFHARIPCARRLILVPWHVSEEIHARQLRRRGEIRICHARAREPIPLGEKPADIFEMIAQIGRAPRGSPPCPGRRRLPRPT